MAIITEDILEEQAIEWFKEIGYEYKHGNDIAPNSQTPERDDFRQVILKDRLRSALKQLNPNVPKNTIDNEITKITNPNTPGLISSNRQFNSWLSKGMQVTFMSGSEESGDQLKLIDYEKPSNNDWLVVNQLTVKGDKNPRRPDLIIFLNGLPLVVIELKNPADEKADIWSAYNQLETYKKDIPNLFYTNTHLVISDGTEARIGSLSADRERFMRWRTIDGENIDPLGKNRDLETIIRGLLDHSIFLEYIKSFSIFEGVDEIIKKIAGYHQFHAVQKAVESVVESSELDGDKKGGVVWHTQGAGKSLEMAFLAGRLMADKRLKNPTIVIVTDRHDLDGQLFEVFKDSKDILGESPKQADSRKELRELLDNRPSGGIIFTTIQKFGLDSNENKFPTLSKRDNLIVICDEAHRTQYGFKGHLDLKSGEIKYGLARALRDGLPNATFLAFTGTPISYEDRDTQAVFGNYISIYDIQQAVEDGATVPIYYESRLAKIKMKESKIPIIDEKVDEIFDDTYDDIEKNEKSKTKWSQLEALVGAEPRIKQVVIDLINHFETRQKTQPGKAIIVAMSREIAARLYNSIIELRPEWHDENHLKGQIKVVMTASASDSQELQPHHTNKKQKKVLEKRFKDPNDSLQIVIVRDMWLTGFDAPCLTTMYVDKPMNGANLAQAIARVNRVFKDKPGGLIVDYIGIATQLKEALATYSASKGKGRPTIDTSEALRILKEKILVARDLLHPIDWSEYKTNALKLLPVCLDHILGIPDGKKRYSDNVLSITKAFALCGTLDEAMEFIEEVAFLQAIRSALVKSENKEIDQGYKNTDFELRQLISESLVAEGVSDVFKIAGLKSPDISVLSDEFLREIQDMPQKNLAVELLNRLINDEIKSRFRTNIVKQRKFSELLQSSLNKYQNRSIEAAVVIEELIAMSKEMNEDEDKRKKLKLNNSEKAFYDALTNNKSAEELMQDEILVKMSKEIAERLRKNITVDWEVKESVRARLRILVRNLLRRYKYPPDKQSEAVELVLLQAEEISEELVANI